MDGGDLFAPPPPAAPNVEPPLPVERERRAKLMLAAYGRLGVDAFLPGETDLWWPPKRLKALVKGTGVPLVGANLLDASGGHPFAEEVMVAGRGAKIGIFGVLDVTAPERKRIEALGWRLGDPVAAAQASIARLRAQGAQVIVGLLHLPGGLEQARGLVKATPGIDVAVLGHSGMNLEQAEIEEQTAIVEAMDLGKHVGRLDLHLVGGAGPFADHGRRAQIAARLADHRRQLEDYWGRSTREKNAELVASYQKFVVGLEAAIARETKELESSSATVRGSWFDSRVIELDAALPDQLGTALLVQLYEDESARLKAKGVPIGVAYRPAGAAPPKPVSSPTAATGKRVEQETWDYGSNGACGLCHQAALEQWKTTPHARALATLQEKKRDQDPACLGCHVTAFWRPGGTRNLKTATTYFADVGCESCHGPSVAHVRAADKTKGTSRKVPATVCLGCHTPDWTEGSFDYASLLKAVLGPGHGAPPR